MFQPVLDANKGSNSITDWEWYADGLANKFYDHAFFVFYISTKRSILNLPLCGQICISGLCSIDVLTRAAMEAFLTFHHVFFAPKQVEDKNYRYWAYILAGHLERQKHTSLSLREYMEPDLLSQYEKTMAADKDLITDLKERLESNGVFQGLSRSQKKQILRGNWRSESSWKDIAYDAHFCQMLAEQVYSFLSGYAHSSSISVLQIKAAYKHRAENILTAPSINVINMMAANMISEYCELFPKSKEAFKKHPEEVELVDFWVTMSRT
jgi:hypothetical protein